MQGTMLPHHDLDPASREFFQRGLRLLEEAGIRFLVGGAYSFARHTGIERHTKDFDIFVRPADTRRTLAVFTQAGYEVELVFPHWLGKIFSDGDDFIDIIFSSGNGIARVDDRWFENAVEAVVLETPVLLCPVEETIWSKSFVMERERFDGADIAHLLRARARQLDWQRLLDRFGAHWRVLLAHLVLFGFVYPDERDAVPPWVMDELQKRLREETYGPPASEHVCQGTLFSRVQYLVDLEHWGYQDAREQPDGNMSAQEIERWTAAIGHEKPTRQVRPRYRP